MSSLVCNPFSDGGGLGIGLHGYDRFESRARELPDCCRSLKAALVELSLGVDSLGSGEPGLVC